jgi:hypothetical protein
MERDSAHADALRDAFSLVRGAAHHFQALPLTKQHEPAAGRCWIEISDC